MKTQDIKNMASAYMQVLEKAKMDKVNPKALDKDFDDREDKDINNDGKVDSSDEYLHNRRKTVKNAIKKEAKDYGPGHIGAVQKMLDKEREAKKAKDAMKKEEVEELDEISRDTARSYISKASAHKTTGETPKKDRSSGVDLAGKKAYGIGGKAKVMATEEVEELDELSKRTLGSYIKKATGDAVTKAYKAGDVRDKDTTKNYMKALGRQIGISKATNKLTKEEVNLSEDISKMSHGRLKFHMNTGTPHGSYSNAEMKAERDRRMKYRDSADAYKKAKAGLSEEVDYPHMMYHPDTGKSIEVKTPEEHNMYAKKGYTHNKPKMDEAAPAYSPTYIKTLKNTYDDKKTLSSSDKSKMNSMMNKSSIANLRQLASANIKHVSDAAKQYIKNNTPGGMKKEEVELDEAAPKMKPDFIKTQREKDREHDDAMGRTPTGRKKAMTSTQRSMASMRKENTDMSMREKLQLQKESILEKEMTDAEMKKREDIVKGMKKNKADFEKRYGSRAKNVMYATATKQAMESVDNALAMTKNLLTTKESFKTENTTWPVYARIKEANGRAMHYKSATPPETMNDKMTASDKAFIAPHGSLNGVDSGIDGAKAAEYTAKHATDGIKPGGGMNRPNDNKTGDKNIIKSTEAK